jgi:hypothetical protein
MVTMPVVGLVTDIHGHLTGLRRALAIFARERVAHLICAGDVVGTELQGPDEPVRRFLIPVADSLDTWLWLWLRDAGWMSSVFKRSQLCP